MKVPQKRWSGLEISWSVLDAVIDDLVQDSLSGRQDFDSLFVLFSSLSHVVALLQEDVKLVFFVQFLYEFVLYLLL